MSKRYFAASVSRAASELVPFSLHVNLTQSEVSRSEARAELTCSIIIPTLHRPVDLNRCLEAVARQSCPFKFEVIVVDNSSGDAETESIASRWGATYVHEPITGLCRARNRGALESSGEFIAYLDDDSVPDPGWLEAFAVMFQENSSVMGAAGRTVPLRVETEAEKLFQRIRGGAYDRPDKLVIDKTNPSWFEIAGFGGIGPGCNMAFRKAAFAVWPGFNERTDRGTPVHGGGEQHAFFSLVDRGFSVAYVPNAVVRHPFADNMDLLVSRHLADLSASTAYFTMLFLEERRHRRALLKYLWQWLSGKRRTWRSQTDVPPRIVSRRRKTLAFAKGPVRYFRGVMKHHPPPLVPGGRRAEFLDL